VRHSVFGIVSLLHYLHGWLDIHVAVIVLAWLKWKWQTLSFGYTRYEILPSSLRSREDVDVNMNGEAASQQASALVLLLPLWVWIHHHFSDWRWFCWISSLLLLSPQKRLLHGLLFNRLFDGNGTFKRASSWVMVPTAYGFALCVLQYVFLGDEDLACCSSRRKRLHLLFLLLYWTRGAVHMLFVSSTLFFLSQRDIHIIDSSDNGLCLYYSCVCDAFFLSKSSNFEMTATSKEKLSCSLSCGLQCLEYGRTRSWGLLRLGFEMCIVGGHCGIDSLLPSNFLTYLLIPLVHPLLLSFDHAVMFLYTPFQSPSLAQSSSWNSSLSIPYSQSNKTLLSRSERVPLDCSLAEIQYLAFIHENLVRWHYSMFGTHNGTMPFFQF
jgi:hypothetical protein